MEKATDGFSDSNQVKILPCCILKYLNSSVWDPRISLCEVCWLCLLRALNSALHTFVRAVISRPILCVVKKLFQVGRGGYGKVYRGKLEDGTIVAIKKAEEAALQRNTEFNNEIELLSRCHHRNLVSLIGYCNDESEQVNLYIVLKNSSISDKKSNKMLDASITYFDINALKYTVHGIPCFVGGPRFFFLLTRYCKPLSILLCRCWSTSSWKAVPCMIIWMVSFRSFMYQRPPYAGRSLTSCPTDMIQCFGASEVSHVYSCSLYTYRLRLTSSNCSWICPWNSLSAHRSWSSYLPSWYQSHEYSSEWQERGEGCGFWAVTACSCSWSWGGRHDSCVDRCERNSGQCFSSQRLPPLLFPVRLLQVVLNMPGWGFFIHKAKTLQSVEHSVTYTWRRYL